MARKKRTRNPASVFCSRRDGSLGLRQIILLAVLHQLSLLHQPL